MNERDKLIAQLIKEKGGTREQYLSLLNKIAYHESGHTLDPTIKQIGGGPGRGKYQFEEGRNQGGITAAKRTKRYLDSIGEETPKWLDKALTSDSLDATKLSSQQQDILFLGNMRMHPKADIGKVVNGKQSVADFWANFHWAGSPKDREERLKSFKSSIEHFEKKTQIASGGQNYAKPVNNDNSVALRNNTLAEAQPVQDNIQQPQAWAVQPQLKEPEGIKETSPLFNSDINISMYDFIKQRKQPSNSGELTQFNEGGTHEENPNGGVPQGIGANGKPNTVEEGESSYTFGEDKFIFTDRYGLEGFKPKKQDKSLAMNAFAEGGPVDPPSKKDPRLATTKAQESTGVATQKIITNSNPLNITSGEDKARNFVNDYIKSDIYKKRLKDSGYENPDEMVKMRLNNVANTDIHYQDGKPSLLTQFKRELTDEPYSNQGSIYQHRAHRDKNNFIMIDDKEVKDLSYLDDPLFAREEVIAHELGHAVEAPSKDPKAWSGLNEKDKAAFTDNMKRRNVIDSHDESPEESYADLMAFRYLLKEADSYDSTSGEKFTGDHFRDFLRKKGKKSNYLVDRLRRLYSPSDIIELMNTVADNKKLSKDNKTRLT